MPHNAIRFFLLLISSLIQGSRVWSRLSKKCHVTSVMCLHEYTRVFYRIVPSIMRALCGTTAICCRSFCNPTAVTFLPPTLINPSHGSTNRNSSTTRLPKQHPLHLISLIGDSISAVASTTNGSRASICRPQFAHRSQSFGHSRS